MITILTVVMVSCDIHGQTHQIVHFKYIQFVVYQEYLNKTAKQK